MSISDCERGTRKREILPLEICRFQVAPLQATRFHWFNQESGSRLKEKAQNMDYRVVI